ncbi:MAG TPA: tetratricopeptide repeat protein [Isosphaeraceae bacterium]|jgi:tetratricopeptide (TPR) repeat protein|nr:tetratricopeptide repeat protein [Isosphaeraceae bacterium]
MSRSIHQTRRQLEEMRRWDYAYGDMERRNEDVRFIEEDLRLKRRYKDRVQKARARLNGAEGLPTALSVTVEEAHPFVHHPLTVGDVEGLVSRFPADVRHVVQSIHLRSGIHEDDMRGEFTEPDPFTGRHGSKPEDEIWVPGLLGRYRLYPGEIDLFGYVYDDARLRVPDVQRVLLWLRQAQTLAHEVAHCWDAASRTARDRWALDEKHRAEPYADDSARMWLVQDAVPYFREKHSEQADAFEAWIETYMGVHISLERAADDTNRTIWGVVVGLREVSAKWGETDQLSSRLDLAQQLHFVDDFAAAQQILQAVLSQRPEDERAVILMGDIAVHEKDWQAALRWTEMALRLAPGDVDAHVDRVDALIGAEDWKAAIAACEQALRLPATEDATYASLRVEWARCLMELGEFADAGEQLDRVIARGQPGRTREAGALRSEMLIRESRWAEARDAALTALRARQKPWHKAIHTAAAWESAQRLDQPRSEPVPTQRHLDLLRHNGRGAWADRLLALGLTPAVDRITRRQAMLARTRGILVRP